jgi:hypothetical protein
MSYFETLIPSCTCTYNALALKVDPAEQGNNASRPHRAGMNWFYIARLYGWTESATAQRDGS